MSYEKRAGSFGACALAAVACLAACSGGRDEQDGAAGRSRTPSASLSIDDAIAGLKAAHPKANVRVQGSRIQRVYGVAATGASPEAAAESFRRRSAAAFGVEPADLAPVALKSAAGTQGAGAANASNGIRLMFDRSTGKYKFRLFAYEQLRDGIPVFGGGLRTLVREDGAHPVVWANADLRPMGNFRPQAGARVRQVDVDKSLRALASAGSRLRRSAVAPSSLTNFSAPTLTIFAGADGKDATPRTAMRYTAQAADGTGKWTFVADAATGDILHVESNLHFDINGNVQAEVVLGSESMECGTRGNAPLPYAEVTSSAGNAFTNPTGAFTIVQSGSSAVNVVSSVTGRYFDVTNVAGNTTSLSLSVTPPGPANFLHRDTAVPPELVLAQLNAYQHANELRDMLLAHVPDYPVIATQTDFPITVNQEGLICEQTGGGWYDNDSPVRSINFCRRTADRTNTAFASILHHEYGHHIVDSGGSQQHEYGEGMADTIAMLFAKDPRIGIGFHLNDCAEPLRNADSDCQYSETDCSSCGPGVYECGALLSGTVWDIWQALDVSEPANSDQIIRELVFSSIPLHTGSNIDPSLAIDFLTLDDDDELIENGTPHYTEICSGFSAHGMDCPPIVDGLVVKGADLDSEGPSEGPFQPGSVSYTLYNLGPEQNLTYSVSIPATATWLTVDSTGGTIPLGEQATVTVTIDQAEAALLADGDYSATIDFVNETSGAGNVSRTAELRVGAPLPVYTATFDDGLEGFTADTEPGNLWHRADGACLDTLPGHSTPGSLYYGREDFCNFNTGTPILHTITSPVIAVANPSMVELGFNYYLATENDPLYDEADVLVSVAGGPFQLVASNNNGGLELDETSAWRQVRVDLAGLMPSSGSTTLRVQFAFNAVDTNANINKGFAVDDVIVYAEVDRCTSDAQCNDGLYCNGVEVCIDEACSPGTAVTCDDGVACTVDSCNETTDSCSNAPDDTVCDDGDVCTSDVCDGTACTHADNGTCSAEGPFIEVNGRVVMEAEHFAGNTPRSGHTWDLRSNAQASGQAVMTANPNIGVFINSNYASGSPELTYPVRFTTTGTYFVWIRGIGLTANDDSCHAGIEGAAIASADRITGFGTGLSWSRSTIDGPVATIQVTQPGVRDINLWMREDGFSVDKLLLTRSFSFVPSGAGPNESPRETTSQRPCAAYCANPITFSSSNYQSGNLGTAATCHETTATLSGGVCGNFVNPRQLLVNGVAMPCNWAPWPSLPPRENGGYCIQTTSGNHPWAAFTTW